MAEGKKTLPDQSGNLVTGDLVEVVESKERFSEIDLEDGTRIRIKPVVVEAVRVDGQWDNDGNPIYVIRSTTVMAVNNVADHLKKRTH